MVRDNSNNDDRKTNIGTGKFHKGKHEVEEDFLHERIEKPKKNGQGWNTKDWHIGDTLYTNMYSKLRYIYIIDK